MSDPLNIDAIQQLVDFYHEQNPGDRTLREICQNNNTVLAFTNIICSSIATMMDLGHAEKVAMGLTSAMLLGIFLGESGKTQLLEEKKEVQ